MKQPFFKKAFECSDLVTHGGGCHAQLFSTVLDALMPRGGFKRSKLIE
ncbi:MAG: hypothetical protein AAGK71_02765 [Pseudomonadota bacterium]